MAYFIIFWMIQNAIMRWSILVKSRKQINHEYYEKHKEERLERLREYMREYYFLNRSEILKKQKERDLLLLGSKETYKIANLKNDRDLLNALEKELKRLKLK